MNAHLVFAHPNPKSYNGQLRDAAIQVLKEQGWEVTVSDLFQMNFKASADENDFTELHNADFLDLQNEQLIASQRGTFSADILREHQLLSEADLIIFQFPLWWSSMPGVLKGYIDRVFSYGWAYGGKQALAGKKILVSMTTGAPEVVWTEEKRGTIKQTFKHLFVGTFELCGLLTLEPFIFYGAKRQTDNEKIILIDIFVKHLSQLKA
jgi:NAD(P)H dehydrogenase (quinone)